MISPLCDFVGEPKPNLSKIPIAAAAGDAILNSKRDSQDLLPLRDKQTGSVPNQSSGTETQVETPLKSSKKEKVLSFFEKFDGSAIESVPAVRRYNYIY